MITQFEEKGKIFTPVISKIPIPVTIQTTTHRIHGQIYIRPSDRLKDELNRTEPFLAVTNASVFSTDGEELYKASFLTINCSHIVWLIPDDEIASNEMASEEA